MGDIRVLPNGIEHNEADRGERWVFYHADDCGKPLARCLHLDGLQATVEPDGRIAFADGADVFSVTLETARVLVDELNEAIPDAVLIVKTLEDQRVEAARLAEEARVAAEQQAQDDHQAAEEAAATEPPARTADGTLAPSDDPQEGA